MGAVLLLFRKICTNAHTSTQIHVAFSSPVTLSQKQLLNFHEHSYYCATSLQRLCGHLNVHLPILSPSTRKTRESPEMSTKNHLQKYSRKGL